MAARRLQRTGDSFKVETRGSMREEVVPVPIRSLPKAIAEQFSQVEDSAQGKAGRLRW